MGGGGQNLETSNNGINKSWGLNVTAQRPQLANCTAYLRAAKFRNSHHKKKILLTMFGDGC